MGVASAGLTRQASTKGAPKELVKAQSAVASAETALAEVAAVTEGTTSAPALEKAQSAVASAETALVTALTTAGPASKAELVKVQSSMIAAKKIVEEAIAKAEATA